LICSIRRLLKPGGILFLTTGNSSPWNILNWKYSSIPDVHISFFNVYSLEYVLKKNNFESRKIIHKDLYVDIIKFKILKNLGFKKRSYLFKYIPWKLITKIVDLKYGITEIPIGVAK
jgi:SAM-dependent methyltransferase